MPTPTLDLKLRLNGSECIFRIRPGRKPDTWVFVIDRGAGAMVKAGQVGQEAAVALRAELIVEAEELRRLGWQDVLSKD